MASAQTVPVCVQSAGVVHSWFPCPPLPLEEVEAAELVAPDVETELALADDVSFEVALPSSPQASSASVKSDDPRSKRSMSGMLPGQSRSRAIIFCNWLR